MRILLDECVPRPLRRELAGHEVRTVQEMGWAGKKNGELLALVAGSAFEILLTVDQNLRHQQNLVASDVAVVVMVAPSNRLADLVPLVPRVEPSWVEFGPETPLRFAPNLALQPTRPASAASGHASVFWVGRSAELGC